MNRALLKGAFMTSMAFLVLQSVDLNRAALARRKALIRFNRRLGNTNLYLASKYRPSEEAFERKCSVSDSEARINF